jgi:predicted Zn-dependent protease
MNSVLVRTIRRTERIAALLLFTTFTAACARNPVTGQRELSLVSESQEIAMGKEASQQINASLGVTDNPALQSYVANLGKRLASASERPNLPWTFTVVEDPVVNAFALPGGPVYITRGILAHMNSEAELVSVLGHEIGHITAKHSVSQISRSQLTQVLVIGAVIAKPELAQFGDVAMQGLGLLFLKYGRDDETQADDLGFKYMVGAGYDPEQMAAMFRTLSRLSAGGGGGGVPEWLSTHPDPGNRVQRTQDRIKATPGLASNLRVEREAFLRQTENLVFGENPREGFFRGTSFLHPDLKFQFDFPSGWKTQNQPTQVAGISGQQDAVVLLTGAGSTAPSQALNQFVSQQGMQSNNASNAAINGLTSASANFAATTQDGATLRGWVAFVNLDGTTFRLLGYTTADRFGSYDGALRSAITSFRRLTDPTALSVRPNRLRLVRIDRAMTLAEFDRVYPSKISGAQLALINGVDVGATLPAGMLVKRVVE